MIRKYVLNKTHKWVITVESTDKLDLIEILNFVSKEIKRQVELGESIHKTYQGIWSHNI